MPELPEVETVLRGLRRCVTGRRVAAVEFGGNGPLVIAGSPEEFTAAVTGRAIAGFERKGKALAIELRSPNGRAPAYLLVRLGMTGQLTVQPAASPLEPHTHIRIPLEGGAEEIRYCDARRFGRLRACTREELDAVFARMGPDAPAITDAQFLEAMKGRRGAVKNWLLNQQMLSGLGNIYADEALFVARLHPLTQPGRVRRDAARRLLRAIKQVLERSVGLQGTSFRDYVDIEGRPGNFAPKLRVYGRTGEPCRRCRTPIRRLVVAGRSSHFCPKCQPRPRHAASPARKQVSASQSSAPASRPRRAASRRRDL